MKPRIPNANLKSRVKAAALHFLGSLVVALFAATLVFGLWYRWPYRVISGGQDLFILLVSVDIVLGPLLTFAIFDTAKGRRHLARDLAVVVILQFTALIYGLYTVYEVRPVALVFEVDRFRVVTALDVHRPELPEALEQYRHLPLTGPWTVGTRRVRDGRENNEALVLGFEGIDIGQRPRFWQPYELSRSSALARSRPVTSLLKQYPAQTQTIEKAVAAAGLTVNDARFLPLVARRDWVVLLNAKGDISGYVPLDGFF